MGGGLLALGAWLQSFLARHSVTGMRAYADDLILALVAGALVFIYEQRRDTAMRKRLEVISALNHHIRNALQAITFSPFAEQARQLQLVSQSAQRIEWALREILPLTGEEHAEPVESLADRHP